MFYLTIFKINAISVENRNSIHKNKKKIIEKKAISIIIVIHCKYIRV